jgi:hypothetical protein
MYGLLDRSIDELWIAQIVRKLCSQIRKDLRISGQSTVAQNGLDDIGDGITVAAMLHLRDGCPDPEHKPAPGLRSDLIRKSTVKTDAKGRNDGKYRQSQASATEINAISRLRDLLRSCRPSGRT